MLPETMNKKAKVLIVDDSQVVLSFHKAMLEQNGYETECAINGFEALERFSTEKFDLIITDVNMPKMDGREAIKAIKSDPQFKQIPVIVFTTSASEDDIQSSYLQGVNTYFTKPTMFKDLVEMISVIKTYWLEKAALTPLNFYIR